MSAYEEKIQDQPCRKCGAWRVELHHLLPRSKFSKRDKVLQNDRDNSIPLCHQCHQDHHTTIKRVPRDLLTQEELAFIGLHIHPSWIDRWYPTKEES